MIRRLGRWLVRCLATAAYKRLPESVRMQIALDWIADSDRYYIGVKLRTDRPYPRNVFQLFPRRRVNAETVFHVPEIGP
jgi:hypothetical protein